MRPTLGASGFSRAVPGRYSVLYFLQKTVKKRVLIGLIVRPQTLGDFHSLYETGLDYRQHAASKVVEGGTVLLGGQAAKAGKK